MNTWSGRLIPVSTSGFWQAVTRQAVLEVARQRRIVLEDDEFLSTLFSITVFCGVLF
jgi:hypothetical protein